MDIIPLVLLLALGSGGRSRSKKTKPTPNPAPTPDDKCPATPWDTDPDDPKGQILGAAVAWPYESYVPEDEGSIPLPLAPHEKSIVYAAYTRLANNQHPAGDIPRLLSRPKGMEKYSTVRANWRPDLTPAEFGAIHLWHEVMASRTEGAEPDMHPGWTPAVPCTDDEWDEVRALADMLIATTLNSLDIPPKA